jgi:hypothetical protein
MRTVGLFLLLIGSLVLLWPWYGHLIHFFSLSRGDAQLYGGVGLMAGIVSLIISRVHAG